MDKLDIAGAGLAFAGDLVSTIGRLVADQHADAAKLQAAVDEKVGAFVARMREGGEFDKRHDAALGKLDATLEKAKADNSGERGNQGQP